MKRQLFTFIVVFAGLSLIAYAIYILNISDQLTYWSSPVKSKIHYYVYIRIIVGLVYLVGVYIFLRMENYKRSLFLFVIISGIISRILLIPSEPILEDDYNRYLWDGALTANFYNPYRYSPEQFIQPNDSISSDIKDIYTLADSSKEIITRINHPHIRTIYPIIAQINFAIAYYIHPWSISTWKVVLLFSDLITIWLLFVLLKQTGKKKIYLIIYLWNPILLHEIFNAGHMDILIFPFIILGFISMNRGRYILASILFSLATGVKIWPIIFLPFALFHPSNHRKLSASLLSLLIITIIFLPVFITKMDDSLGFITYTKNWTNNEAVFQMINFTIKQIIALFEINYHCSLCVARWITFIFYSVFYIIMFKSTIGKEQRTYLNFFYLIAVLYLISPTQFPWYYIWTIPLLVLVPRISFIGYTILLPLYQLKYEIPELVWIEHVPIILIFIVELSYSKVRYILDEDTKPRN